MSFPATILAIGAGGIIALLAAAGVYGLVDGFSRRCLADMWGSAMVLMVAVVASAFLASGVGL